MKRRHRLLLGAAVVAGVSLLVLRAAGVLRVASPADDAAAAKADEIWAHGNEAAVRDMFRAELDRLPESEGKSRARVFLRFGIIDTNPDGQAALFSQACAADPTICDYDRLKKAAEREVHARLVAPGNHLPLYFGGHPK
jgi:hypothetical protein